MPGVLDLEFRFCTCFCSPAGSGNPLRQAWNSRPGWGLPQAPCLAQVCCGVSVCIIGRAATSVASVHFEMRPEAKPVESAPGEAGASCSPEKAQTGDVKACRPTPGAGIPRHGWGLRLAQSESHSALTLSIELSLSLCCLKRFGQREKVVASCA